MKYMELLLEIHNKDIGEEDLIKDSYRLRRAARAVILNDKNEVSIQYVSKYGYYKLPGGGVEKGETIEQALKREVLEEVGVDIEIKKEIGMVIQYRNNFDTLQFSYAYLARMTGGSGIPSYEKSEIEEGYTPMWFPINEAISLIDNNKTDNYAGKFMVLRDSTILKKAKEILNS